MVMTERIAISNSFQANIKGIVHPKNEHFVILSFCVQQKKVLQV